MCGISGIISLINKNINEEIKNMNSIISHRGPDGEGFYEGNGFIFGHRRLSIIELSDLGKQPMEYRKNVITYNGEIYNYIELRNELSTYGYSFMTGTDTEVILAAYDYWGTDCLNKFNGMWSFAIYDSIKNIIFCSRDRFGIKPFYYLNLDSSFYFGSEIKQFTVLPTWKSILNHPRAYDFFAYGIMNHTHETLFKNVYQLKGGEYLVYDLSDNIFEITKWYSLDNLKPVENISNVAECIKNLFFESINLHLRSDVKVGSCLSGGIDSSSIVCTVNQILKNKNQENIQETVSAIYHENDFSEEKFINIVTSHTKVISHKVYPLYSNIFDKLDSIIWHQDEPFVNLSIFAQWNVFEASSQNNIKVMLDGQGADEYMAGYESFYGIYFSELLCSFKIVTFFAEFYSVFKKYGFNKAIQSFYWTLYNFLNRLPFFPAFLKIKVRMAVTQSSIKYLKLKSNSVIDKINKIASKSLKKYSNSLLTEITIPTLLHYEDRNSMAFSIESRVPFLDFRLVEFFYSLPSNSKIQNAVTKYMFREAMKDVLPSDIKNRKDKVGFATPQFIWVNQNLDFFRSELENSCNILNKIIETKFVLQLFDSSIKKENETLNKFWSIIIFARWSKIYKVEL